MELNIVIYAYIAMSPFWEENSHPGPVKLMNKNNTAPSAIGNGETKDHAEHISKGGAVKLTSLAGPLFHDKDDKKGHQDSYKFFMEESSVKFPDTGNTRFQSYCDAAGVLLVYQKLFIKFLCLVKYKKGSETLNNMEANVLKGLKDLPTIQELVILTLFSQIISNPYMCQIQTKKDLNALTLSPLHHAIAVFMEKIIADPEIVFSPNATYEMASFDGKLWERPKVFYKIQSMVPSLPYICPLFVKFMVGALVT